MYKKIIILLSLCLMAFSPKQVYKTDHVHAFILIGQSNMVGHSTIPKIQQVSNYGYNWIDNDWQVAIAPLFDGGQYGPANQFIISLLSVLPDTYSIGVIPCAVDSSMSSDWMKSRPLYQRCINLIWEAQSSGASIDGIIVMQGEANTSSQALADLWISDTTRYINDFENDFGDTSHVTPVILAQLGYDPQTSINTHWTYLHDRQTQILMGHPYWRMIVTDDLSKKSDNMHFTTTSNIVIGQRLASAWCVLVGVC